MSEDKPQQQPAATGTSPDKQAPKEKDAAPKGAAEAPTSAPARGPVRKKSSKFVTFAKVFIQSTFNNTIISITDDKGDVLTWASAGSAGFKGTRKGTPFAAQMTATKAGKRAVELGVKQVAVFVSGPGPGRETAIRGLQAIGLHVLSLKDVSPLPHNGCRRPKPRRV